jgi:hypothetical protein
VVQGQLRGLQLGRRRPAFASRRGPPGRILSLIGPTDGLIRRPFRRPIRVATRFAVRAMGTRITGIRLWSRTDRTNAARSAASRWLQARTSRRTASKAQVPMDLCRDFGEESAERRGGESQECRQGDDHGEYRQHKEDQDSDKLDLRRQPIARVGARPDPPTDGYGGPSGRPAVPCRSRVQPRQPGGGRGPPPTSDPDTRRAALARGVDE